MRKLIAALCAAVALDANAALIVGQTYQDGSGKEWVYIGDYDVGAGPASFTNPKNYTALEAAMEIFGPLSGSGSYAISTADDFVDHLAWYDGVGSGEHLPEYNAFGLGVAVAENFFVDVGDPGYNTEGDFSAFVGGERATFGGGAFNHVFVDQGTGGGGGGGQDVPEPGSLALLGAGLCSALAARRKASRKSR